MSRTYRRYPRTGLRNPRGYKQARIHGTRKKAIPPSPYEDIKHNKECFQPLDITIELLLADISETDVRNKLRARFKLSKHEIDDVLEDAKRSIKFDIKQ